MFDDYTRRSRIIQAALNLAKTTSWTSLSLSEIAAQADLEIADIRREFADKADILRAFSQEVDRAVLDRAKPDRDEPAIDRLFDVLMTRFEVLAPFKASLRAIARDLRRDPLHAAPQAAPFMASQYWMLNAANIDTESGLGSLRVLGLAGVYGRVMRVWFADDDPGHARTMAALDRELRRGAGLMRRMEAAREDLLSFGRGLRQAAVAVCASGRSRATNRAGRDDPARSRPAPASPPNFRAAPATPDARNRTGSGTGAETNGSGERH